MLKGIKGFFKSFDNMLWGYKKVFKASPEYVIYKVLHAVLSAFQDLLFSVFLLAFLLSCIEKKESFAYAAKYIIGAAILMVAKFIFEAIGTQKCLNRGIEKN